VPTEQSVRADIPPTDEIWLAALRAAGRSPATIASYRHAIGCLQQWRGTTELEDVTRAEAYGFVQWLGDNYQPGGVAIRVRSLRAYYGWLVREELIDKNPFKGITVSVPAEAKLTPSEDEIDVMLAKARGRSRDHALLMLLVDSGARKGEVAALTVNDVDLASGMVTFRVSKTVARTVPLTDRSIGALGKWLRQRGERGGSLWGVADPYSLVRAVLARYSTFTPHSLRRAAAVRALRAGISVPSIERLFGWRAGSAMLQTYVAAHADTIAHEEFARLMR
jgi:integrase